ncbi:MAG TPA: hypothetical protein PLE99_02140 [Candidatus Thiothrix moscowensis]|uniref:hypothetical protein n=1 Tax=unclassified Thiothrix TaxID=2636184 RepID=UPI0025D64991|nr:MULTISPECIES: hypothetical protein [unclassified Thiothrix]HRJ51539.1 hypothetical protein [Candidatus Thiothrix moscowensis]HRJ91854.1 hypothetical protein [Candidatus Thiothrix moscowensis]
MSDLENIRQKIQKLNPEQLQMLAGFVGFLFGQQDGTIAADAEYSTDYTAWRNNLRKDVGFIEKYANDPVHLDEDADFLSRDEANKR